ncbi:MAG: hypothetical protein Q8P45_03170 [Candidatus Harrisonbacteria bacterium]|nr:hypothetical protein [Candidatus Harrisonbacteria bacterium]
MVLALQILLGLSGATLIALLVRSLAREPYYEEIELPSVKEFMFSAIDWFREGLKAFQSALFLFFGSMLHFLHKIFQGISTILSFSSSKMKEQVEGKKEEQNHLIDEE